MSRAAVAVIAIALLAAVARADNIIPCPIDCAVTPDVQAEVDACVEQATLCNPFEEAIPRDEWDSLLGVSDPSTVTKFTPTQFVYQPTNETVDRVSCIGLVANDTLANGTIVFVCIQRFFCYIDPTAVIQVGLADSVCFAGAFSFPGVQSITYTGPATILGGGFFVDPRYPTDITFTDITFNGAGTTDGFFADCMQNSNVTIRNSVFIGWDGEYVLRAEACDYHTGWIIDNVTMSDVPGTAIYLEGMDNVEITDFTCQRCATTPNARCGYIKMAWTASRTLAIIRSSCWRVQDLLPPRCRYCLTGDDGFCGARCDEGIVEVYDRLATDEFANCPFGPQTFRDYFTDLPVTEPEFDFFCRIYSLPVCNFIQALDSQNFTRQFTFPGGDIIWEYDRPLLCEPGGEISPLPGPFFLTQFENRLGDPVPIQNLPPLPPSPGFVDGSWEDVGTAWTSTPDTIVVANNNNPPARSPTHVFECEEGNNRNVVQTFTVTPADLGKDQNFAIYAQPTGSPSESRYNNRFIRLLIDGNEISRFEGSDLFMEMTPNVYEALIFDAWNASTLGAHTVAVQCNFNGGSGGLRIRLDDAEWAGTSSLFGTLLDGGFEPHILTWVDDPVGQVISPEGDGIGCPARTGIYRYVVTDGDVYSVAQSVAFPDNGVYAIEGYMQRRNDRNNYVNLTVDVTVDGGIVGQLDIPSVLPTEDDWTAVAFVGQIIIAAAPEVHDIGLATDFSVVPSGNTVNLCLDDVSLVAIGTVGVVPDTLGFSSQAISSMPRIAQQTCDCDNFTAPVRNVTELPCQYALTDEQLCIEEVPSCCAADYLNRAPLAPSVFTNICSDLADPSCVFLLDCDFLVGGEVINCTQITCPAANVSRPLADEPNIDYLLTDCTALPTRVVNGTVVDSATPDVVPSGQYNVEYTNVVAGKVWLATDIPGAFYQNCALADQFGTCDLYGGCTTLTYNATANLYTLGGCDLLNCTEPSLEAPTQVAQFAACVVAATGQSLDTVDGGWVFQANGDADIFDEPLWLWWLRNRVEPPCETMFEVGPNDFAPLAPACSPHAYFRRCPCCPTTGDYTVPADADPDAPGTDTFYSCADGVSSCRCNQDAIDASNPAPNGTVSWWIANAPDSLGTLRIVDNRGQQHEASWVVEQLTRAKLAANTIVVPHRDDERGICRLLLRNDNEFTNGEVHDCFQGNPGGPYTTTCDVVDADPLRPPCPLTLTREDGADCFVDDRATEDLPGFGTTIFNVIQDAVEQNGCDSIYVRFNTRSSYFEESIDFDKGNKDLVLWSLEGAIIVGQYTIQTNTDNITFVGLRLIHPAENRRPLFDVDRNDDSNLNFVTILNSQIDGSGCRKCGIFDTKRLNDFTMNFTAVDDFEFFALKLDDAERVVLAHNTITDTVGRAFLIKYQEGFVIDSNALVETRGGNDLKGAAIFSLTAKEDDACDRRDVRHQCLFRNNVQSVNITQVTPRFQDVCFYFARGLVNFPDIYDNTCRLAENGMILLKTDLITSGQATALMMLNPLMRPSLFQIRDEDNPLYDRRTVGTDYVFRGTTSFVTPGGEDGFLYSDNVETDYDTFPFNVPIADIRCGANRNWDARFAFGDDADVAATATTGRMGVERFSNVSIGVEFCQDRRETRPVLGGDLVPAFILYVRSFNGSRLTPEEITMQRDGWLIGDDTDACCRAPEHRPAIVGTGHRVLTRLFNMTLLTLAMPLEPRVAPAMWSSGPLEYDTAVTASRKETTELIPAELCFFELEFDGRFILPPVEMWAADFLVGELQDPRIFRPQTNRLPPFTESFFMMEDSVMRRFPSFSTRAAPGGGDFVNVQGRYPFVDGMRLTYVNRLNTSSVAHLDNNTFADMDKSGLHVFYANNQTIANSRFFNCSGRARGNEACVRLEGNDVSLLTGPSTPDFDARAVFESTPARMFFLNNTGLMTEDVLFEFDDRRAQRGYVSHFWIDAWPNTTDYCVINGTSDGLPIGLRQSQTANFTLPLNCPFYEPTAPVFPDFARFLRAQCEAGDLENLQGTVHDLAYGEGSTDLFAETVWCDSTLPNFVCCPLVAPDQCWVVQTPELLLPTNPWLGLYVFDSLNTAIEDCAAQLRIITVVGSGDPFGTGDTTPKVYTEVIDTTVPLTSVNGTDGPMLIRAGAGVTWRSTGNRLDTQCVFTTLQAFDFEHDGAVATAIWDQQWGTGTDACNLRFKGNDWNVTVDERAMEVVVGDNFTIVDNEFTGNNVSGTRRGVELRGNGSCTEAPVIVASSEFRDFTGFGLDVRDVGTYEVRNNMFDFVGGRDFITQIPYSVYASVCTAPPLATPTVVFDNNRVRTVQTATAAVGCMATCWLGNVPLDDKTIEITNNDCRGLEFGIRFENMPDTSPAGDPKEQLRNFALVQNNIRSQGFKVPPLDQRFDLVRGPPADDASLKSDPEAEDNVGRWCTDGCPVDQEALIDAIIALLAVCLLILLALCCVTGGCTPSQYRDPLLQMVDAPTVRPNRLNYGNGLAPPTYTPMEATAAMGAEMAPAVRRRSKLAV